MRFRERIQAGAILLLVAGAESSASAETRPVAVMPAPAGGFDVLVPVNDDALSPLMTTATWQAHLKHGGAKVSKVEALAQMQPPPRLEVALAFDLSASFNKQLPAAQVLAKRFVESSAPGFDTRFSVHAFGYQRVTLGTASSPDATKALVDKLSAEPVQQRTQLRRLVGELVEETGRAVRFPDGVREVVLFTDAGEESTAFSDYAQITDPATSGAVMVHAVLFQPNTPSPRAATLADQLAVAVERTGGQVVRVNPSDPNAEPTLRRLRATAALPSGLQRVHVEACALSTGGPGEHDDELSFSVQVPGHTPWRSPPLPARLEVPPGGAAACAPPAASASAATSAAPAPSGPFASPSTMTPPRDETPAWPWLLLVGLVTSVLAIAALVARRSGVTAPETKSGAPVTPGAVLTAPVTPGRPVTPPGAVLTAPVTPGRPGPEPTPPYPPPVVPSSPWLIKQGANPLARTPTTELHVEASPLALGSPLRIARPEIRVGRDPSMDLPLDHPLVSHHHATFFVETDGELYVVDHGSTHGTFLGEKRLSANERHHVPADAHLSFSTQIRLRVVQPWRSKSALPRPGKRARQGPRHPISLTDPGDPDRRS